MYGKLLVGGSAGGLVIGGLYGYRNHQEKAKHPSQVHELKPLKFDSIPPETVKVHKTVNQFHLNKQDLKIQLFQYHNCPFCCRTRAFLDYYGYGYDIIEVNSVTRSDISWAKPYRKVPLLVINDGKDKVVIRDSSVILSLLNTFHIAKKKSLKALADSYEAYESVDPKSGRKITEFPNKYNFLTGEPVNQQTKAIRDDELKWRKWNDDILVHILSPNIYQSVSEAVDSFETFSARGEWEETFSAPSRYLVIYLGAIVMFFVSKGLKKKYNLDANDVRKDLYNAASAYIEEIEARKTPYLGGQRPNLADLSIFGSFNSIEGCRAFHDVKNNVKGFAEWYSDLRRIIHQRQGAQ